MTDDRSLDMTPRAEFADRLEADLLRVIRGRNALTPTPQLNPLLDEEPLVNVELTPNPPPTRPRWMMFAAAAAVIALVVLGVALVRHDDTKSVRPANSQDVTFTVTWSFAALKEDCAVGSLGCLGYYQVPVASNFDGDITGAADEKVFWDAPTPYPVGVAQNSSHQEFVAVYGVYATVPQSAINRKSEFTIVETVQNKAPTKNISQPGTSTGTYKEGGTMTGTWQIVPESGRGVLAGISGSGTSTGNIIFGDVTNASRTFTGTIACSSGATAPLDVVCVSHREKESSP